VARFPADRKHPAFVARLQRDLLLRMAEARGIAELRGMLPELRERVEEAALEIREGRVPPESLSVARRQSKAPERYVAETEAGAARGGGKQHGRAAGFLDGSESPYLRKYEAILREAAGEVLGILSLLRVQATVASPGESRRVLNTPWRS
jgi:hypothetical protein